MSTVVAAAAHAHSRSYVKSNAKMRVPFGVGLFLLAVVVRLAFGGVLLSHGPEAFVGASDDGDAYDAAARWQAFAQPIIMTERLAHKWSVDRSVPARWPHGYWLFLAGQYRVLGSADVSTVVLQALIGAGGVLAAYTLARNVLPARAARLAGGAVAASSTGIILSAALYAESLYIPLLGGGLALIAAALMPPGRAPRATWLLLALGGAAFALAEVIRPLALPVFIVAALWCVVPFGGRTIRTRSVLLLVLCAGFGLALAPFVAHDIAASGQVTTFTVGGAEAYWDQSQAAVSLPVRVAVLFMSGWAPLGEPLVTLLGPGSQWVRLGQWVLAALGAVWLVSSAQRRPGALLLGLAALAIVGPALVLGLPLVRYRAPADPLFIVAMVGGLVALRDRSRG